MNAAVMMERIVKALPGAPRADFARGALGFTGSDQKALNRSEFQTDPLRIFHNPFENRSDSHRK